MLLLLLSEAYKANRLNLLQTETNCENKIKTKREKLQKGECVKGKCRQKERR